MAFDPEHRLVVSVVSGKRTEDKPQQLVAEFRERAGGRLMNLMTSEEHPAYKTAIFAAYAVSAEQARTGRRGRPRQGKKVVPKKLKADVAEEGGTKEVPSTDAGDGSGPQRSRLDHPRVGHLPG